MHDKKILVTGGAGSIGSELVRQLCKDNKVYILDLDETDMFELAEELKVWGRIGDVCDPTVLDDIVDEFGYPDIIFHAAARKHVMPSELDPIEAVKTNIMGTWNIIKFARKGGCDLVNISTDKVVNAESVMGLTKKVSEKMVRNAGYVSVRFGNVMRSKGSLFTIWDRQLKAGQPLTVTDKRMERYMMSIPQASELVIKASEIGSPGDIVVMDMGKPRNIYELAKLYAPADYPIEIIGIRPGEMLSERLMTVHEYDTAERVDNFWVLK